MACNGACTSVCAQYCISVAGPHAVIDDECCIECGNCVKICPVSAIREE